MNTDSAFGGKPLWHPETTRRLDRLVDTLPVTASRDCEVCPKVAWQIGADEIKADRRVRTYVCGNGHLKIVTEAV